MFLTELLVALLITSDFLGYCSLLFCISLLITSDIEVSCYGYDGIDAVKNALMEGLSLSDEEMPIKVL